MGVEVYYAADIRNALLAAEQAVGATVEAAGERDEPFAAGFLTGYRAALTTLALAFGVAARLETHPTDWDAALLTDKSCGTQILADFRR